MHAPIDRRTDAELHRDRSAAVPGARDRPGLHYSETYRAGPGGDHPHWRDRVLTDAQLRARIAAEDLHRVKREEVARMVRDEMGPLADCLFWFHPKGPAPRFPMPFKYDPKPVAGTLAPVGKRMNGKIEISVPVSDGFLPRLLALTRGLWRVPAPGEERGLFGHDEIPWRDIKVWAPWTAYA